MIYLIFADIESGSLTGTRKPLLPFLMKHDNSGCKKSLPPDKPMFAFCGIGDPNSFINSAEKLSLKIEGRRFFKDHQDYTDSVIHKFSEQIRAMNISNVLTTEKDLVKLPNRFLAEFEVYIIKIKIVFEFEKEVKNLIQPLLN